MVDLDEIRAFARAVGHALRVERNRRGWTLAETSLRAGLSLSAQSGMELGVLPMDMRRLVRLCAVLDVAPAQVITVAQAEAFPLGWPHQHDCCVSNGPPLARSGC